jgi:hypothetical protein
VHVIKFSNPHNLPTLLPQTWELLSLVAGLQIATTLSFPIFSDCQSMIKRLNSLAYLPTWRQADHLFLFSAARQLLSSPQTPSLVDE